MMREANEGVWRNFHEYNNLLWMHYLSTKLFEKQKRLLKKFDTATKGMLKCNYSSISEYIISDDFAPIFSLVDQN
uniref:[Acyl-carrier-protein] phosphodiesterase n=1 Tax=Steinernema glaseri TaxID=37863 RepID=A0A1I8A7C0_9BILA